ncbi:MAG: hypothetical protein PWQ75_699 [Methanolobus sp.]|uniref:glycosyltransferase family 4 protein n=1 Tax=Methanolobus sp. TaxID=1874737 RepID=UPI002588D5C9|nr:glycosyltransferase family 4 protein [Methanolobus sp.]MDK2830947.1 hypothetical protein [Methanolobus sp.]
MAVINNPNKKRVILSICDISPSKLGSFEEFLIKLSLELMNRNIQHIIVFRDYPICSVEKALTDLGVGIKVMKPSKININNFIAYYKLIKEIDPDVVHFHFYPIYSIINYLKIFYNCKIIYTDHMGGRKAKSKVKKVLRRIYYQVNFLLFDKGIDKVICVSEFVKDKYLKDYGVNSNKLCVIYNGINMKKFSKKSDITFRKSYDVIDTYIITCVGLRRDKGPHYLLKAAPSILEKFSNISFMFVGEGECKNYMEDLASQLGIKDKIIFTGKVPDLSEVYSISSVVVIPSTFEEAFCFVAAEAMATECPVVAFDSGAIKEVLYDSSFIIDKNYNALALKIIECISTPINAIELRNHVLDNFELNCKISEHVTLYTNLMSK